jgi:hypothetical protein
MESEAVNAQPGETPSGGLPVTDAIALAAVDRLQRLASLYARMNDAKEDNENGTTHSKTTR